MEPRRSQSRGQGPTRRSTSSPRRRASEHGIGDPQRCAPAPAPASCDAFAEVYNVAWSKNWGFVPLLEGGPRLLRQGPAAGLSTRTGSWSPKRTARSIAIALTVPDINQVLEKMKGRLLPLRLAALPARQAPEDRPGAGRLPRRQARVPAHRASPPPLHRALRRRANRRARRGGEMGWILETNEPMNRAMEGDGRQGRQALPDLRAGPLSARKPARSGVYVTRAPVPTHALARVDPVSEKFDLDGEVLAEEDAGAGRRAADRVLEPRPASGRCRSFAARSGPPRSPPPAAPSPAPSPSPRCAPSAPSAPQRARRAAPRRRRRDRPANVVASRSFLVDVHLLGR